MGPRVTFLISIGLCLGWVVAAQMDPLPRPTLWADPSPVDPSGADVTLRCQGHLGSDRFQLWKDGELREERNGSWQQAEFVLRSVDAWRDGRSYSCRSGQGPLWSDCSESLALVVTGTLATPSISASPGSTLSPGKEVTIRCQVSPQAPSQEYSFVLLETKSLEPLQWQRPAGTWAAFSIRSVRPQDSGSDSCVYFRKKGPHSGSHPSETLELTVLGQLPRPTLWAQLGLVLSGGNITLWCSRPKLYSLEGVTFTLWKAGTQEPLQQQTSAGLWRIFSLPSVTPEDTGSYSCTYKERTTSARESEPSEAQELVVPGFLPKPSLSAVPGLVVEPEMHVTLQCRQPRLTFYSGLTFVLLKVGTPQRLQKQSPAGASADFPLVSVRAQDAGRYICVYYTRMALYQVSELSEVLEIWVTDALPKPSLSAWPQVVSGAKVTFLCQGPPWATRIVLYKEGENTILKSVNTSEVQFLLTHVGPKDSGNYSCRYQLSTSGSLWTQRSDPLQLIVTGSEASKTLIILTSVYFLFCLLLLGILCKGSLPKGSLQGESPTRCLCCSHLPWTTCLPHQPEAPREETLYSEEAKERPRKPLVPIAEGPQETTYAQLNIRTLNKSQSNSIEKATEHILYGSVSGN